MKGIAAIAVLIPLIAEASAAERQSLPGFQKSRWAAGTRSLRWWFSHRSYCKIHVSGWRPDHLKHLLSGWKMHRFDILLGHRGRRFLL